MRLSVLPHIRRAPVAALALACVVLALGGTAARAADAALVTAAEKEGQLVVYGGDISETPYQVKRFMEVYPKIKATFVTAGGWQLYNRYMSEHSAGQAVADAFTNVEDTLLALDAAGHLSEFRPEALKNFPADLQVGNSVRTKLGYAALVFNTEQMKGQPVPDDWTSFATPPKAWEDRIAYVDPRGSSVAFMVLAALSQNYGEEKTRRIYEGLKSMRPEVSMNTPGSVAKLVSGERPLMMYILTNHLGEALRKGAPLDFKIPASHHLARRILSAQRLARTAGPAAAGQGEAHAAGPEEGAGRPEEAHRLVARRHRHPVRGTPDRLRHLGGRA
jgi:iron(III) transport system substrate-binding protein